MRGWRSQKIRELGRVFDGPHATLKTVSEGPVFLGIPSLNAGRLNLENTRHVSEQDFKKWTRRVEPRAGDIVFSYETKIGEAALIPEGLRCCLGRRMGLVRLDRAKCEPRYFLYQYLSPGYQQFLASRTVHGATVDRLLLKDFPDFEFPVPPIDEQREIAATLGVLDDKIELNRRMAATLEAMARALYRSWFVDFDPVQARADGRAPAHMDPATAAIFPDRFGDDGLPEGWRNGTLADLIDFNPREKLAKGSEAPYLDMKALPTSGMIAETAYIRPFTSGTKFRVGDTLLARITPCLENGKTAMVDDLIGHQVGWGSTEFIVMRGRNAVPPALPYCVARDSGFREEAIATMTGSSGRQRADAVRISQLECAIPAPAVLHAFAAMTDPLIQRIHAVGRENQTLAALRDALLPRLMSGELRVGAAREMVEDVA